MVSKKATEKGLKDLLIRNDVYQKQHNFLVIDRVWPLSRDEKEKSAVKEKMKPENREKAWRQLFEKIPLPLKSLWRSHDPILGEVSCFRFFNGLEMVDSGSKVFFDATEDKQKVDMNSAISIVRCAANHLYRETGVKPEISTNRPGSNPLKEAFEQALKDARKIINNEEIMRLKAQRTK